MNTPLSLPINHTKNIVKSGNLRGVMYTVIYCCYTVEPTVEHSTFRNPISIKDMLVSTLTKLLYFKVQSSNP